ncbi:hypothetical protein [Deinococcus aerius]|nr:hypothetical protein [Deinococcus aerius]
MSELLSERALENLRWLVRLWRKGYRSGAAFDLNIDESEDFDSHPDVLALRELEGLGYVDLHFGEVMRACWTLAVDLTDKGMRLVDQEDFADDVPCARFPFP